jgi:hypothetical protein
MRPVSLVLGLGLLAALAVACQQPVQQPPMSQATASQTCANNGIHNGDDFVQKKAFFLTSTYRPQANLSAAPPTGGGNVYNVGPYSKALIAAFDIAPDFFKNELCSMDAVYILQTNCAATVCTTNDVIGHSWGFRQIANPTKRYIAISDALWYNGAPPILSAYENMRLQAVLAAVGGANWFSHNPPQFVSASPDTNVMTMLSVLAHEAGHVLWYDTFVPQPGGQYTTPLQFCNGFYPVGKWTSIGLPRNRWVGFADQDPAQTRKVNILSDLAKQLAGSSFGSAAAFLAEILRLDDLTGVLAVFSPTEDFVEAYELNVLLNASTPLAHLTIQIPNLPPAIDIVLLAQYKPELRRKMRCFLS